MAHEKDGKLVDEQNIGFHEKLIKTGEGKVTIVLSNGTSVNTTAEMHLECDLTNGFVSINLISLFDLKLKESLETSELIERCSTNLTTLCTG
ncbi:hypothetical protein C0J52_03743 [Blattella germanica]|nr:hypothetical protein C0J52_03743 [Blattella germanica]